jgi:T5SS/PEP-CTERM-associated repeat protein
MTASRLGMLWLGLLRLGLLGLGWLTTAVWLAAAPRAGAQTVFNWDPPAHLNIFSTAGNWTPAGPPGTTGEARFNNAASAYTVSFNTDPTNARMRVGHDHAIFDLNGHTYTLTTTSTSSPSIMVAGITLADDALLTIRDGTLAGQHAVIAPAIFQTAAGMVVDTGGALDLAGTFTVGKQLLGSLTIQNGGDVTSATGVLGESGNGNGIVTVTGAGSTWHNSGSVYVGGQAAIDGGNGTISITNQGLVDVDGTLRLWPGGNVALDGGTLETASMELAGGSFNWTSGTLHLDSDLIVEPSGLFGGSVAVGAGKVLNADLLVGDSGSGTFSITNGGYVSSVFAWIGDQSGSMGSVTVDGTGSIGKFVNVSVGNFGDGALEITNGGRVDASGGKIGVGIGSSGSVTIDGHLSRWVPELSPAGIFFDVGSRGSGTLNINNGAQFRPFSHVPIQLGEVVIGRSSGSIGTVRVDGADSRFWFAESQSLVAYADLFVGLQGQGVLLVTGGGSVASGSGFVAFSSGGTGSVTIDGPTSVWTNVYDVTVGRLGDGIVILINGGTIKGSNVYVSPLGEVNGDGNIAPVAVDLNVQNGGLVSPGNSISALNIYGDYTQVATGELLIELSSVGYDQLLVTGDATLAGTLTVDFVDGFIPDIGQTFTMLTADDVDDTFTTESLPSVPGRIFDVIYNPQSVVLTVLPAFTADFDEDGDVDAADLAQWQGDFGPSSLSDADNDGDSDGDDFLAWQRQLGSPAALPWRQPFPNHPPLHWRRCLALLARSSANEGLAGRADSALAMTMLVLPSSRHSSSPAAKLSLNSLPPAGPRNY